MTRLFKRRCAVIAQPPDPKAAKNFVTVLPQAVIVDGLRVKFEVKRTLDKTPNQSYVEVFNMSETHRSAMQKKGTKVILQAGFEDTGLKQLFNGDARLVENIQQGPDWITKFHLGDGERAYRLAHASLTFAPGVSIESVVRALADALQVDPSDAIAQVRAAVGPGIVDQYVKGYAFHGRAASGLDDVLTSLGLTWSIQDGKLQVLSETGFAKGETVLISPSSGLIGSPAFGTPKDPKKPSRLKVKSLLQPTVKCGGRVTVQSRAVNGVFKVHSLSHTGDTHGGDWYTELELL